MLHILVLLVASAQAVVHDTFYSGGGKFKIKLTCQKGDGRCGLVKQNMLSAVDYIEKVFSLRTPINANVRFLKEIDGKTWGPDDRLAETQTRFSGMAEEGVIYGVARALFKQRYDCPLPDPDADDFFLNLNFVEDFYLPGGNGQQGAGQYSIFDVIAHEFLHGMGFTSLLDSSARNSVVSPQICTRKGRYENTVGVSFVGHVFDKHLFTSDGQSIVDMIAEMNAVGEVPIDLVTKDGVELFHIHLKVVKKIEKYATGAGGLYFLTNSGEKVLLETGFAEFRPASSISHLDSGKYRDTPDELMIHESMLGSSIADRADWPTYPYGPSAIKIMCTIGYRLKPGFDIDGC